MSCDKEICEYIYQRLKSGEFELKIIPNSLFGDILKEDRFYIEVPYSRWFRSKKMELVILDTDSLYFKEARVRDKETVQKIVELFARIIEIYQKRKSRERETLRQEKVEKLATQLGLECE